MADKSATVYIVDVGRTMGQHHSGRSQSDLDFAMQYVWDKITTTISNGRKTDTVGVIGFRTDYTNNALQADDAYSNISVFKELGQFLMPHVRECTEHLQPSETNRGDGISALVVGIQLIKTFCRHLKYRKSIYLITDGRGSFDTDGLDQIVAQLKSETISLTILGVDFDDAEYGFKEEDKPANKAKTEAVLHQLAEDCSGVFATIAEAIDELVRPRVKEVRPVASYKGTLTLGDPEKFDTAMSIDIERYPRTMLAKPVSASRYVVGPTEGGGVDESMRIDGQGLQAVKQARVYQVPDESAPGGKKDIDKDDMEKGYKYGRTIVPISKIDENVTVYETKPGMEIVGFTEARKYKRFFHMSNTNVIVPQKLNDQAAIALSSLIHTLAEYESYAIVRFVKKANEAPVMIALAPNLEPDFECLIDVQLPFIEDFRPYKFPPLNTVRTVTGKTLSEHRFIPTDDMNVLMSAYVDSMDLSDPSSDGDDFITTEDTFSPILHRVNQIIRYRATHPDSPLPPVPDILMKYSHPPPELIGKSQPHIDALIKACDVKRVTPVLKSRRTREQPKPKSGLDIDELLGISSDQKVRIRISLSNAVAEYKQKISADDADEAVMKEAASEMFNHARELVKTSIADLNYGRARSLLAVVREEMGELEYYGVWNDEFRKLKKDVLGKKLDGDRSDWWEELKRFELGLLEGPREAGGVDWTDAKQFWNP
ncbi:ATP-dependent DNA helicase II subunit 2 [Ascodesmis nigricans]|uniref:ATP-dependent DNA helicase II subunit 2 n=1 Tax=Ascodesmis nigricans TaxID=341454 RepID=A0A4S2MZX9_9PEZI|nr:ATP-dependent DNA helicase II subunit 2 [Ascodesmis nigricans]